jgi:hypothetical protein
MMINLSVAEYKKRISQNLKLAKDRHNKSTELVGYLFADLTPEETKKLTPAQLLDQSDDIIAANAVGALPMFKGTGHDALFLKNGRLYKLELKFAKVNSSEFTVGARGGVRKTTEKSKIPLQSLMAQWQLNSPQHLKGKGIHSALIVYDNSTGLYIDAWLLSPKQTLRVLTYDHKNQIRTFKKKSNGKYLGHRVNVRHNVFEDLGKQIPLNLPNYGSIVALEQYIKNRDS